MITILQGDATLRLLELPDESVQCCVTSPPYWGLRDYGTEGQLGMEKTPEEYVAKMVAVFREVRRVLRDDATCWINLGDSYATGAGSARAPGGKCFGKPNKVIANGFYPASQPNRMPIAGLKPKDLIGIPWLVARSLQQPYYAGRIKNERDRVWLAATLDAEGSICGFTHIRKDDGTTRTGVHVNITNSNMALLDEAHRIWPVSRADHNAHGNGHIGKLPMRRWIAHNVDDKAMLMRELYPYMIAKKKQVLLAYNFFEMSRVSKRTARSGEAQEAKDRRAWLMDALSRLNHAEDVDVPSWCVEPPSLFEQGYYLRQDIIWAKPNPMPESVTDRCTKAHEYIFLLTKNARYYYDADAIREPYTASSINRTKYPCHDIRTGVVGHLRDGMQKSVSKNGAPLRSDIQPNSFGGNKRDVWTIATQSFTDAHFATFPRKLVEPCVLAGSRPGDIILDPFAGSGTTGMVALELARKAILIELNPAYIPLIQTRTNITPGLTMI